MDTFTLTIIFIIACTVIGAFIKGRAKDSCLKKFSGYPVVLEKKDGKRIWGKFCPENACMELVYDKPYSGPTDTHLETSYIQYKSEYGDIFALVRYIDKLDTEQMKARVEDLEKASNPGWYPKVLRRMRNVIGTVRDSFTEVINLFVGRLKTATPAGKLLEGQDKHVAKIQEQGISAMGMSYEPILEKYIGKKAVLALMRGDKKEEYSGILEEYTPEFICILDTEYKSPEDKAARRADLVVPRGVGIVRHAGP